MTCVFQLLNCNNGVCKVYYLQNISENDVIAIVDRQEPCPKCGMGEADTAMKDAKLNLTSLYKLDELI